MKIKVLKHCDGVVGGKRVALFEGQAYDVDTDSAESLIAAGAAQRAGGTGAEAKAVKPKEDK